MESARQMQDNIQALYEISQIMNTGLDKQTLVTCMQMIEAGANPEALAAVIRELRKETQGFHSK
ncbi:Protein of unknown function DUF3743 domain-containing protein [Rozella allomycis CSF55]|uniref:Mitotic-spindle organizing protein 1 n=1 Tax=Rozella allomycis (strain CSF55) TaxID=988480 RepID=A0A075AQD8_ROZAC|nr:Protein of unknown function DUF3743 domain-containing protein [Rozella allomycis CSF55]|eukprot:EPZ30812.1 Protein of unknown function DUF3743 domain-containing protein [Rozella allomycis CSF55]